LRAGRISPILQGVRRSALFCLTLATSLAWTSRGARSQTCSASLDDWEVERGSLRAGTVCGELLAATDGAPGGFSYVDLVYRKPMHAPLDLEVTWWRLGPESGKSLELRALGALVLVSDGKYGLYTWNETAFEWRKLPGYRPHDAHRVSVHQTETSLTLFIDGRRVDSWPLHAPGEQRVGVAAKGAGGYRSWVGFRDFLARSQ
jgi:hypothetical protein